MESSITLPKRGQSQKIRGVIVLERGDYRRTLIRVLDGKYAPTFSTKLAKMSRERMLEIASVNLPDGPAFVHLGCEEEDCPHLRSVVNSLFTEVA